MGSGLAPILAEIAQHRPLNEAEQDLADRIVARLAAVAAGIAAFLFRLARVMDDGREAPVVDRPDEWWAVPARLRTVHG